MPILNAIAKVLMEHLAAKGAGYRVHQSTQSTQRGFANALL